MSNPTQTHLMVAKRVLRYLQGTKNYVILYKKGGNAELSYTDIDYAADV